MLHKFHFSTSYPPLLTYMNIAVEITATYQPEHLICIVRIDPCVDSDANNRFEQLIIIWFIMTKTEGCENITKMNIGLWKIDVTHFVQKIT